VNWISLKDDMNKDVDQSGWLMSGRRCLGDNLF